MAEVRPLANLEEIVRLREYLDSGQLFEAYKLFSKLRDFSLNPAKVNDGDEDDLMLQDDRALQHTLTELLDAILKAHAEGSAESQRLPRAETFAIELYRLKIGKPQHFDAVLLGLVQRRVDTTTLESTFSRLAMIRFPWLTRDIELARNQQRYLDSIFTTNTSFTSYGLFAAWLLLIDADVWTFVLTKIWDRRTTLNLPSPTGLIHYLSSADFPHEEIVRLMSVIISNPPLCRRIVEQYRQTKNLTDLVKFYQAAHAMVPEAFDERIFALFISSLRSFNLGGDIAQAVWKDMVLSGVVPGPISWNVLLLTSAQTGKTSDKTAILRVWENMISSNVKPDVHCWTTLIHQQMQTADPKGAITSLRAMVDAGVPPSTTTINAAVDGLLNLGHHSQAQSLITEAEAMGVPSDLVTYNTIIRSLLSRGAVSDAFSLLELMASRNIRADVVTLTTIVDGIYKKSDSSQDEVDKFMSVLALVEPLGIEPNVVTFTALIDGLLRLNPPNHQAISSVRGAMAAHGVAPNIYTMTVYLRSAFRENDFAAAKAIWAEIDRLRIPKDRVVFQEMILNCALRGDMAGMQQYSEEMREEAQKGGWDRSGLSIGAATTMCRILDRRGEGHEVIRVVQEIVEGGSVGGEEPGRIEEEFWGVVEECGGTKWAGNMREWARARWKLMNEGKEEGSVEEEVEKKEVGTEEAVKEEVMGLGRI